MYGAQTADDLAALRDAARAGRAAAMSRRRALAAGKLALALAPAASSGRGTSTPAETVVAIDGVAAARLGRAFSMQRRRQMSQGKQALNDAGDRTPDTVDDGARALIVYRGGAR